MSEPANERLRLVVVCINAAAMVVIVLLQDPVIRRDLAAYAAWLSSRARRGYHHDQPSPLEVSAVLASALKITKEAAPTEKGNP